MALSPEKMAEFLANELIDDMFRLANWLDELCDRWTKYGNQYEHLLTDEKRAELNARFADLEARLDHSD